MIQLRSAPGQTGSGRLAGAYQGSDTCHQLAHEPPWLSCPEGDFTKHLVLQFFLPWEAQGKPVCEENNVALISLNVFQILNKKGFMWRSHEKLLQFPPRLPQYLQLIQYRVSLSTSSMMVSRIPSR